MVLTFADGQKKLFDAKYLLDKTAFEQCRSLPFFKTAHVEYGTVVWNDDLDIAPEYLYETSVPMPQ